MRPRARRHTPARCKTTGTLSASEKPPIGEWQAVSWILGGWNAAVVLSGAEGVRGMGARPDVAHHGDGGWWDVVVGGWLEALCASSGLTLKWLYLFLCVASLSV